MSGRVLADQVAVLRYARTCFRTPNHFIHRYFVKQDLIPPLLELLEEESTRDNMLSSSCMDVLTAIRTVSPSPLEQCNDVRTVG